MAKDDGPNEFSRQERNFAAQVRKLREERGWSQSELAEKMRLQDLAHVNQATVSRIENLTRPVRLMEAQALSSIFGRTTYTMTNPDSSEVMLHFIEINHTAGCRNYVKFKDSIRAFAESQLTAKDDLKTLFLTFGPREDLDPEVESLYHHLIRNLTQLSEIDLLGEATDIVRSVQGTKGG